MTDFDETIEAIRRQVMAGVDRLKFGHEAMDARGVEEAREEAKFMALQVKAQPFDGLVPLKFGEGSDV